MRLTVLALLLALLVPHASAEGPRSSSGTSRGESGQRPPTTRPDDCCTPRSKGFWHRQCLGIGALGPGRGQGKGPGLHPAFSEGELRDIVRRANRRMGGRCEGACDALYEENYRTARGRAMAQFAALVLNHEAGFLRGCDVDGSLLRRIERLLDQERWEEAKDAAEEANLGRSIRRCQDDRDEDRPHRHGPGCGHHDDDGHRDRDRDREGRPDDDDDDDRRKPKDKDKDDRGKGKGKAKGKDKD